MKPLLCGKHFLRTPAAFCLISSFVFTHPFRPIALSCLLTAEGWTETPVDCFRSEARMKHFLNFTFRHFFYHKIHSLLCWTTFTG